MTRLANTDPRVAAFLDMIAVSEIGRTMLRVTDDGYDVLVGSTPNHLQLFTSYAAHPRVLNKELDSTAAGRYQIIWPTWKGIAQALHLTTFTPEDQDKGCIYLIEGRHAMSAIQRDDIEGAISLCSKEWASLPGAGYGQHENTMTDLLNAYAVARAKYGT